MGDGEKQMECGSCGFALVGEQDSSGPGREKAERLEWWHSELSSVEGRQAWRGGAGHGLSALCHRVRQPSKCLHLASSLGLGEPPVSMWFSGKSAAFGFMHA